MRIGIKLLVAAAVGALTYLLTGLGEQQALWRAGVAVAVGAFALVALLLVEAAEASRRLEVARKADDLSRAEIGRLVTAGSGAPSRGSGGGVLIDLDVVRSEGAERAADDPDWLLGLTDAARFGIDAVTMASYGEGEFWSSDLGRRYLERQRAAIGRDVRIRRLFLLTERAPDPERIRDLMAPHRRAGVETRAIRLDDVYFLRQTEPVDYIVFDQKVSYEFRTARVRDDGATPPIAGVALVADPRLVKKRQEHFEQLWAAAR